MDALSQTCGTSNQTSPKTTPVTSSHAPPSLTAGEAVEDPRRYDHLIGSDRSARQHNRPRGDTDAAVADCRHFPENRATAACLDHNTHVRSGYLFYFIFVFIYTHATHLLSMRDTKLILREPKNAPRPYRETMSDQIMVTMCGGGGSLYLSTQLLLMKLWMNCGVKRQIDRFHRVSVLTFDLWRRLRREKTGFSPVMENSVPCCDSHSEKSRQFPGQR